MASALSADVPRGIPTAINLEASDHNGDMLTYAVETAPTKGQLDCTGPSCTYLSDPGATGTDTFTFLADDGFGGTDTATVTCT